VTDPKGPFVKAIFCGSVIRMDKTNTYFETNGPVVVEGDILTLRFGEEYSFIMKDIVVEECIKYILTQQKE
jgi:8-oxo-dGTP diphosphatase